MSKHQFVVRVAILLTVSTGMTFIPRAQGLSLLSPWKTSWSGSPGQPGSWSNSDLWTNGVPDATQTAGFGFNGIAVIDDIEATARSMSLGSRWTGAGSVEHRSGSLTVGHNLTIQDGTYTLTEGEVNAERITIGAAPPVVQLVPLRPLPILWGPFGRRWGRYPWYPYQGRYFGRWGAIDHLVDLSDSYGYGNYWHDNYWHDNGYSQFVQDGGTVTVDDQLSIDRGEYQLNNGLLSAANVTLDDRDSLFFSGPSPRFQQNGGTLEVANRLLINAGSYEVFDGLLQTQQLSIGDPSMLTSLGSARRRPEFKQMGGEVVIAENLELCAPGFVSGFPRPRFSEVSYRLDDGSLSVGGTTIVGSMGTAPARFWQYGGVHSIGDALRIEGRASSYEISRGQLTAGTLEVGSGVFNEGGRFSIRSPAAEIEIRNRISFGAEGVFEAVPGSVINFSGITFENRSTDPANLSGFENLTFIVSGDPDIQSHIEVAGRDFGNTLEGFENNFAFNTLQIGAGEIANVLLVDLFENQSASSLGEALYVEHLVIGAGSSLNLGSLNIYYQTIEMGVGATITGGNALAIVPECATIQLCMLAVLTLLRCRSRRPSGMDLRLACREPNTQHRVFSRYRASPGPWRFTVPSGRVARNERGGLTAICPATSNPPLA